MKQLLALIALLGLVTGAVAQKAAPLSVQQAAQSGYNYKVTVDYTDLVNNGGGNSNFTILLFPPTNSAGNPGFSANSVVDRVGVILRTPFTTVAAASTNLAFSVGDNASTTQFTPAFNIHTSNTVVDVWATNKVMVYTATNHLKATFNDTVSNTRMTNLNAGKVDVYLRIFDLDTQ